MSDADLRELRRRWNESGADEDEAAYLLRRVSSGDLGQGELDLAAYCGSPAARLTHGGPDLLSPRPLREFLAGLTPWGDYALVRAMVAIADVAADRLEAKDFSTLLVEEVKGEFDPLHPNNVSEFVRFLLDSLQRTLRPTRAWVLGEEPSYELLTRAVLDVWEGTADELPYNQVPLLGALALAQVVARAPSDQESWLFGPTQGRVASFSGLIERCDLATPAEAHEAAGHALVAWTLGYSDPVRERVKARQQEAAGE